MIRNLHWASICICLTILFTITSLQAVHGDTVEGIPIIDAHSQFDQFVELSQIIKLLNEGQISRVILSDRSTQKINRGRELLEFGIRYPDRITPAVRTKGGRDRGYFDFLNDQAKHSEYGALAEVISTHAAMKNPFFELQEDVMIPPDDSQILAAVELAQKKGWPFIIHIEFKYIAPHYKEYMSKLEKLLEGYRSLPMGLIHMGQLDLDEVRRLIEKHPNIFFMTSTANTIIVKMAERNDPKRGWINMFDGQNLKPEWQELMIAYPNRFVLAFDNVFKSQWGPPYLRQIELWRRNLVKLPDSVAHVIAHGNAERLWRLPPALPVR